MFKKVFAGLFVAALLFAQITVIPPGGGGGGGGTVTEVSCGPSGALTCTGTTEVEIDIDPAYFTASTVSGVVALIDSGTAVLGTSAINANSCATVVTETATGTLTTDVIVATFNADVNAVTGYGKGAADGLIVYSYPTTDSANFKVCNATASSITPGAATLNWKVIR